MGDGSLGYAERLSFRHNLGGKLGEPEIADADLASVAPRIAERARARVRGACVCTRKGSVRVHA